MCSLPLDADTTTLVLLDPSKEVDWLSHNHPDLAHAHAKRIAHMTGDTCAVVRYGPSNFRVVRYDFSEKQV